MKRNTRLEWLVLLAALVLLTLAMCGCSSTEPQDRPLDGVWTGTLYVYQVRMEISEQGRRVTGYATMVSDEIGLVTDVNGSRYGKDVTLVLVPPIHDAFIVLALYDGRGSIIGQAHGSGFDGDEINLVRVP